MHAQNTMLRSSGRMRRRRARATGAAVAVLGIALVGGSALVEGDALPTGGAAAVAAVPAAGGTGGVEAAPAAVPAEVSAEPVSLETSASPAGEGSPPWQDTPPPLPEGGLEPENPSLPNAWEIPDARPTGVDALDFFGAPMMGMNYPRMVPVFGAMVCNTGAQDVEPLSGQDWMYYLADDEAAGSVDIVVTGWADSTGARDALRDDTMTFCVRDVDGDWEQLAWTDHEGDDDYLLYEATSGSGLDYGFAIVRQGDYLVGVTVTDTEGEGNADAAAEIASKTADNLEALDPDHGRD